MRTCLVPIAVLLLAGCGDETDRPPPSESGWAQPETLANPAIYDGVHGPSLDGDEAGNVVAVWAPTPREGAPILARRASPTGWSPTVETVSAGGASTVGTPSVRVTATGFALAIWSEYRGLMASTSTRPGVWTLPELIGPAAKSWDWGLDDDGNALVIWSTDWRGADRVRWNRYEPGAGWGEGRSLPGAEEDVASDPAPGIAVGRAGYAIATWARGAQGGPLWAISFDPATEWAAPQALAPELPGKPLLSSVFAGTDGDGFVFFYQRLDGQVFTLFASFHDRASGFGVAQPLGPASSTVRSAAIDPTGATVAFYPTAVGLERRWYQVGAGWDNPSTVEGVGGYDAIPLDPFGNGRIFWNETVLEGYEIRVRRLDAGIPVGEVEVVPSSYSSLAWFSGTPMDSGGGIVAGWHQEVPATEPAQVALIASRRVP